MGILQLLFAVNGRAGRSQFWNAVVLFGCFGFILLMIVAMAAFAAGRHHASLDAGAVSLLLLVPIGIRRLHDREKSGWWLILFYGLPVGLSFVGDGEGRVLPMLLDLAGLVIPIWAFVELGCLRGTSGPNRFGPDPRG